MVAASSAVLDGLLRDMLYAWRTLRRAPLAAATIVVTVGLGLGLVAAVYTILNAFVFRVDEVLEPRELFGVERGVPAVEDPAIFTRAEYDALLRETDVFVDAFASTGDASALVEGVRREGRLVTGNFFTVLGAGAARGRAFTPADDEPGSPAVMVLSHRAWVQHYASDPAVVGGTYRVNDTPFEIIGVMPDGFRGLEIFAPDFWAPLAQTETFNRSVVSEGGGDGVGALAIVGRLKPGVSSGQAQAQLVAWDAQREAARAAAGDRPAASLVLTPRMGTVPRPAEAVMVFMPLFFAFGLILLIGCANVANLLLARLVTRQREIGIRLSIGASRARVVWQLLTESLLLALFAAAFGFAIARLALNGIVYFIITSFPPDLGNLRVAVPAADWRVVLFLVAGALAATVLFALGPALKSTRLEIARTIHGQVLGDARPSRARNALIALQVTGSALLLICAALFLRGAWSAANVDPGFRTADTVNVTVLDEEKRAAILELLQSESAVTGVSAAWPGFMGGAPAYGEGATGRQVVRYQLVSPEFFEVLGIDLVRGRGFSDAERNPNEAVAVVSETVARELWPNADAIGQALRVEPDPTIGQGIEAPAAAPPPPSDDPLRQPRVAVVVGIARDVAGFRIGGMALGSAGVYLPIGTEAAATALTLRVRGDVDVGRRVILDRFAALDPNMAQVATLQTFTRTNTYILATSFWLTLVLGALALLLTLSGLFSVLSYLVEQRTREIGVRMALGASSRSVGALVVKQSAWPVAIGLGVGSTLTVGLSAALLATPAAEQIGSIVQLFDPVAYAASLVCIVAACAGAALVPALRAGRVNPLEALRQD
jgi:predicted permease